MSEIDVVRTNPMVDPVLHVWGWEIAAYLFLGGLAAGVMILTAPAAEPGTPRSRALRWLPFAAPAALSLGMLCLLLDLEHKRHVWRFYLAFKPASPMSWGAWILVAVYPVTLLRGLAGLEESDLGFAGRLTGLLARARRFALSQTRWLGPASVGLGVALGVYTGVLLGALGARAAWNSALLGPLFLASGLSAGAAFLMLFPLADRERHAMARWDLMAIGVEAALLALFLIALASGGADARAAADLFLGGRFTATFWSLVVIGGLAVPAAFAVLERRLGLRPVVVGPALVLIGGLALRAVLVAAGQA